MAWINQHRRLWLASLVILWLGALSGPWGFDVIHVPAEYECTTAIRLEGDFCGLPFSGFWALSLIIREAIALPAWLVQESAPFTTSLRSLLFVVLLLLAFTGPLVNTFLLITGASGRRGRIVHGVAWGLSAGYGLLLGTRGFVRLYPELWGIWLYLAVALAVLALELLAWAASRRRPGDFVPPSNARLAQ